MRECVLKRGGGGFRRSNVKHKQGTRVILHYLDVVVVVVVHAAGPGPSPIDILVL